jgi:hypothetical protein
MIRIGVTGHRILAELEKVRSGVSQALSSIEKAFPGEPWTVISSLAEGADRLVVEEVLTRPGSRLVVPLPLQKADYLTDFGSPFSRQAFLHLLSRADEVIELPPARFREQAYEAAGQYVVDHCDVLIAVWDGQEEQGRGGTAWVVAEAKKRSLPVARVHAGNRKPGTKEPTSLGEEQGRVSFENFQTG